MFANDGEIANLPSHCCLSASLWGRFLPSRRRLMLAAASSDAGRKWSRAHVIGTDVPLPQHMRAAVGPRGRGWLVYDRNAGNQVRAIALNVNRL